MADHPAAEQDLTDGTRCCEAFRHGAVVFGDVQPHVGEGSSGAPTPLIRGAPRTSYGRRCSMPRRLIAVAPHDVGRHDAGTWISDAHAAYWPHAVRRLAVMDGFNSLEQKR